MLKAEAFESVACSLYGVHEGASRLLDTTDPAMLRAEVVSVHDNIRAMGLDPRTVQVPDGAKTWTTCWLAPCGAPRLSVARWNSAKPRTRSTEAEVAWTSGLRASRHAHSATRIRVGVS